MYLNYMFGQQLIIYLRASINPFIIDMPAYLKRGKEMRKNVIAQVSIFYVTLKFLSLKTDRYDLETFQKENSTTDSRG